MGVVEILQTSVLGLQIIVPPPDEEEELQPEEPPELDHPPGMVHCAVHVNPSLPLLSPASHTS